MTDIQIQFMIIAVFGLVALVGAFIRIKGGFHFQNVAVLSVLLITILAALFTVAGKTVAAVIFGAPALLLLAYLAVEKWRATTSSDISYEKKQQENSVNELKDGDKDAEATPIGSSSTDENKMALDEEKADKTDTEQGNPNEEKRG
ncbi:MAG: hypothetical protein AUG51_11015 [Acidobacteria bacterium 13_1_20CM_3_53_8]|nr:MAG: hypothetical protein AUG51_11015 [Acidobacteria bacterium 13_1_20CM_3_53_8]